MDVFLSGLKRLGRRIVGCDLRVVFTFLVLALPTAAIAGDEKAFQAGLQLGARWGDNQIVREGEGADFVIGVALGWVFHGGWVLFGDANYSQNPTPEFCDYTPNCRWSTPKAQVLTARVGVERRFVREAKKSHWATDFGSGRGLCGWRLEWTREPTDARIQIFTASSTKRACVSTPFCSVMTGVSLTSNISRGGRALGGCSEGHPTDLRRCRRC